MKKILHVISSPRGDASISIKLGNAIIEKLQAKYPDSDVHEYDLVKKQFPHLEEAHLTSFFTPPEDRTAAHAAAISHSEEAIKEIEDADIVVIGAPIYNFSVPSTLKAWIDHIVRAGITFKYDETGAKGLLNGKKVYLAIAAGGMYSDGTMKAMDFVEPYLRSILGFIGLTDITAFWAEGIAIPELKDQALEKAINNIHLN